MENFTIKNGKFVHEDNYPYDFHTFDYERTISLLIILPGIVPESIRIKIDQNKIKILASIKKEYHLIYKRKSITLEGYLHISVHPKSFLTHYNSGILTIELAKVTV